MASEFVVTKKVVKRVIDGHGPLGILMSVVPKGADCIDLVIGSGYENKCSCAIDRKGVGELIDILMEIQEAM